VIEFTAIAPHGEVETPELLEAMNELGRRFGAAACDAAVVVTPHNVHVEGHFAVVTAARVGERRFVAARRVVVVALARDRPLDEHVALGAAVARASDDRRRVALLASADLELVEAAKADSLWQLVVLQGRSTETSSCSPTQRRPTTAWRWRRRAADATGLLATWLQFW
jgi:aromatic ring-opening dioxygenase LigB subunit